MNLTTIFVMSVFTAFGLGIGAKSLLLFGLRWNKHRVIMVDPGTNDLTVSYEKPKAIDEDTSVFRFKKAGLDCPTDSQYKHAWGDRPAWLINKRTGSPMVAGDAGKFSGLDGRTWYLKNNDGRVTQVHSGGTGDIETLVKYALLGLVIVLIGLVGGFITIAKLLQDQGAA